MLTKTDSKPAFLSDKSLDSVFKYLHKKFPNIDNHAGAVSGLLPATACPSLYSFLSLLQQMFTKKAFAKTTDSSVSSHFNTIL